MQYSEYREMSMQPKKIIQRLSELPTMPSTIGTMAWNETGDWRYLTPLITNKLAPCSQNCPAGIPIPSYLNALRNGSVQSSLALLLAHNPLPGLTGRLCYHPCQTKCTRKEIDQAISVRKVERFLADIGIEVEIEKSKTADKRVVVIGSGPLGLSCAFYLSFHGCQVVILDPSNQAGGALLDLSPEKIEPQVLANEINRLVVLADIKLETGAVIDFDSPGEPLTKADLLILDPTGLSEDFTAPARAVAFDPFDDSTVTGKIISVTLPKKLKPFKAPMIAHYIAVGRLTARKAFDSLVMHSGQPNLRQPSPDLIRQAVNVEDIKIEHFLGSDLAPKAEAKQEGIWDRERALKEAERCLSCGTCNLCLQCVSFCPDASIRLDEYETSVVVDLDHCKGCGICAHECPRGIITMEEIST
jgi:Pyruvate/2-oxoacid:ferredoxin oxidoreductase delta subunit